MATYKQVLKPLPGGKYEVVAQFSDDLSLAEFAGHPAVQRDFPEASGFRYSAIQKKGGAIGGGNIVTLGADGQDGFPAVVDVEPPEPPPMDPVEEAKRVEIAALRVKIKAKQGTLADVLKYLELTL